METTLDTKMGVSINDKVKGTARGRLSDLHLRK